MSTRQAGKPAWLDYGQIPQDCVCGNCAPGYPGPPACRYRAFLRRIVVYLRTTPIAPHMRLFGSAAGDKARPGDLDLMVDLDDPAWTGSVQRTDNGLRIPADQAPWIRQLLTMARHAYGSIDPFVRWQGALWARNDTATGWILARNARSIWADARDHGVPILDVRTIPHVHAQPPHSASV